MHNSSVETGTIQEIIPEEGGNSKREEVHATSPSSIKTGAPIAEAAAATETEMQVSEDDVVNNGKIIRAQIKEK